jgi:hypothetical protein
MTLEREDFETDTWKRLRAHIEGELAEVRERLESPLLDADMTQVVRGRIAALKGLLALETALAEDAARDGALLIDPQGSFD